MKKQAEREVNEQLVKVTFGSVVLDGILAVPSQAEAIVVFAHGSGSSRFSHRNLFVAESLQKKGLATLLFDLLTRKEEEYDDKTGELRFDISLLTMRLAGATAWLSFTTTDQGFGHRIFWRQHRGSSRALCGRHETRHCQGSRFPGRQTRSDRTGAQRC